MKRRWDFSQQTRGIWLIACVLILATTTTCSILIYVHVSRNLTKQVSRGLFWEAKLYKEQLEQVFHQVSSGLDGIINAQEIKDGNFELVQSTLNDMKLSVPGIGRSWVIYDCGRLIPSPSTRHEYLDQLEWWQRYLSQGTLQSLGHVLATSQMVMGRPFLAQNNLSTIVPLLRFATRNSGITRLVVVEVDINQALFASGDWSHNPVSLFTSEGNLLARPNRYYTKESGFLSVQSNEPLMELQMNMPRDEMGFAFFSGEKQKQAGVFLRVPALGMIITVERSVQEVMEPVRFLAVGLLLTTVLSVMVAAMIVYILYNAYRGLQKAEQLALSAEFRALQANINPHFLFNTLDRMVGKAVATNNNDIVDMLRALADLFRYTISRANHSVTVEEELKYLQRYVYLQQHRYGDRFQYSLEVDQALLGAQVPKFSIQPVVENCFIHAVEESMDLVRIKVKISREGNVMKVLVSDTGPGIDAQREKEVIYLLQNGATLPAAAQKGMGLSNIHKRLQHLYGRECGIRLHPLHKGLEVEITLPVIFDKIANGA